MWEDLRARHGLKPSETVMIGDNASDVAFGLGCGLAESILVLTGHGARFAKELGMPDLPSGWMRVDAPASGQPTVLARDLAAAASFVLGEASG
jgi:D-glycero-D-manno-heptose 1,7-bisphosphate phosphatase